MKRCRESVGTAIPLPALILSTQQRVEIDPAPGDRDATCSYNFTTEPFFDPVKSRY